MGMWYYLQLSVHIARRCLSLLRVWNFFMGTWQEVLVPCLSSAFFISTQRMLLQCMAVLFRLLQDLLALQLLLIMMYLSCAV